MKILSPISNLREMNLLIEESVDEMYFGLNSHAGLFNNRRPSTQCNIEKTSELRNLAKKAIDNGIKLNFTCNAFIYPIDKLQYVLDDVLFCYDIGVRDIIISDINLLQFLKQSINVNDLHFTLSTCAPVYNNSAINFYKTLDIVRICLPRHLSICEIETITQNSRDMQFEVIVLNSRCINEDGYCCFEHGLHNYDTISEGGGCQLKYEATAIVNHKIDDVTRKIIEKRFECLHGKFLSACAACLLPQLQNTGVECLKIVGREFTTERKIRDIRFIRNCLNYLEIYDNLLDYRKIVKELYRNYYNKPCEISQCYYN